MARLLEKLIKDQEDLATFTHGLLFGVHSLGVYYNFKKKRYIHAFIHAAIASYDLISGFRHYGASHPRKKQKEERPYLGEMDVVF